MALLPGCNCTDGGGPVEQAALTAAAQPFGAVVAAPSAAGAVGDEPSGAHDTIRQYARAVQQADVDALRSITFGPLREPFSMDYTGLIAAQLACDTRQQGDHARRYSRWTE